MDMINLSIKKARSKTLAINGAEDEPVLDLLHAHRVSQLCLTA